MAELSKPSVELAQRILTEVGFEDRIKAFRMREHVGPLSHTMYKFEDVYNFLDDELPAIDLGRLERWFRETFADRELADKVSGILGKDISNLEKVIKSRELMGERLAQAKEIASDTTTA